MARAQYGTNNTGQMQTSVNGRWVDYNSPEAVAQRQAGQQRAEAGQQQQQQQFQMSLSSLMDRADPFASQRSQYATKLSDLMGGGSATGAAATTGATASGPMLKTGVLTATGGAPASATSGGVSAGGGQVDRLNQVMQSNPFFQASQDAAQEAGMRRLRAMGMGESGNAAIELSKIAQQGMGDQYFKMADLLGRFSGANESPSAGTNAGLNLMQLGEQARQFDFKNSPKPTLWPGQQPAAPSQSPALSSYWGASAPSQNQQQRPASLFGNDPFFAQRY